MPSIAQQDYKKFSVAGNNVNEILGNNRLMAFISKSYFDGTIYDILINMVLPNRVWECRVLATDKGVDNNIYILQPGQTIKQIQIYLTYSQYTVRADMVDGGMDISSLSVSEDGYLYDGKIFACVDGNYIAVTLDDNGYIDSYTLTNIPAVDVETANIPIGNVPGLIGIYA